MANAKIKSTKMMCIINTNAVRGHLSKNYLIQKFSDVWYILLLVSGSSKIQTYHLMKFNISQQNYKIRKPVEEFQLYYLNHSLLYFRQ